MKCAQASSVEDYSPPEEDASIAAWMGAIDAIVNLVPESHQLQVRREISRRYAVGHVERPKVLSVVRNLFEEKPSWAVKDLKVAVHEVGVSASAKSVYNALSHLHRVGTIRQKQYGHYVLSDGTAIVSSDNVAGDDVRCGAD